MTTPSDKDGEALAFNAGIKVRSALIPIPDEKHVEYLELMAAFCIDLIRDINGREYAAGFLHAATEHNQGSNT